MKTSDDGNYSGMGYRAPTAAPACTFRCARCDKPSLQLGSGVRMVRGLRQKVCRACKEAHDLARARAAAEVA